MKGFFATYLFLAFSGWAFPAEEWPQLLGPNRDGTVTAPGLFDGKISLKRIWIEPLGSGFSGVLVGGGMVFTMHSAGEMDALSGFDAATGKQRWTYAYGKAFPKVGSSEPGPLSTPVLDGALIYGLGARGELFCVETGSGKRVWSRDIVKELGAIPRDVGLASSPLISGDFLIVNVGDEKDKGIAAFHKKTGVLAWHLGDENISFQSPTLTTLMGRKQVVSLSETKMRGLDPSNGAVIWEHPSKALIQMYAIGDDLMLSGHFDGLVLQRISYDFMSIRVDEKWSSYELPLQYAMPIHHKGYLYGFRNGFLTCLKLESGERVWSSPDVGQGMAIIVDGHLAILGDDGIFSIARAGEKGYAQRATVKVFEQAALTAPSYADGVFYMRNYTQLAAVRVSRAKP